jgi:ubiquinone/menaquinone biosynthesis C-methylase UbiE
MSLFLTRVVDSFGSLYDDEANLASVPWFTAAPGIRLMKAVIDGLIPRDSDVIDLGCGPGCDAVFLATAGAHVTGIDQSPRALEHARKLADWAGVPVTFLQRSALQTGLPDACADIVNDSFVFHNVKNEARQAYATEVHRLLRPGGLFLLNSFSNRMVDGSGPRRIGSRELLCTFNSDRFDCRELVVFRDLPTAVRPNQFHWFGVFEAISAGTERTCANDAP